MVASARLFEIVLDLPYSTALIFGTFATLAYVFLGGFLAVSWTDTIQAAMMCLALIIAPVAVMIDLGGFTATIEQVRSVDPTHLNMLQGQTFIGVISLLAWGLGYFGQPHILVRFMAAKNASVMPRACKISMIWLIFSLSGAVAAGFFGSAFFSAHPDLGKAVAENHERVFMILSTTLFNPWIGGILLSDILGTAEDVIYRDLEDEIERNLLNTAISRLNPRDKKIVELRFGLNSDNGEEMTQQEVADLHGD